MLEAALDLIAERGFRGCTTSLVAEKAGVGMGTIYRYFPTKDILITRLYAWVKARSVPRVFASDDSSRPWAERVRGLWIASATGLLADEREFRFLDQFYSSPHAKAVGPAAAEETARYTSFFSGAVAAGAVRPLPPAVFVALFFGPMLALARSHHNEGLAVDDQVLDLTFEGCWAAVRG